MMRENDIMVLDRVFRDVRNQLESKNIKVLMHVAKRKPKQLTTEESNFSRCVTKIRSAVEAVHGKLKQKCRLLDQKLENKLLPHIGTYLRIASKSIWR